MQQRDPIAKTRDESRDDLRGEDDLRNKDDHTIAARERRGRRAQVHLGLAARSHAVKQEPATRPERARDLADRDGLRPGRRKIPRAIFVGKGELSGHASHRAGARQDKPAFRQIARRGGRPAGVREIARGHRARGESPERQELTRADTHRSRERVAAGGAEREDRFGPLTTRGGEAGRSRAGRKRGRDHRAHGVGEPAPVALCDPAGQLELVRAQEWDRMHQGVDGFQLARTGRPIERHDDTGNGSRSEADANEVSRQKVEALGDEIAEGARGAAYARENGDLGGPGRHSS